MFRKKNIIANQNEINIKDFESLEDFWGFITKENKWYLKFSPHSIKNIEKHIKKLALLIINTTNELRFEMEFSEEEYWDLLLWDRLIIDNNGEAKFGLVFKQNCSSCRDKIDFHQRYPKIVCPNCREKLTDNNGRKVEYFNSGFGGCQGYYANTEQSEEYNSSICYIDGIEFVAEEARFGGIVIEKK